MPSSHRLLAGSVILGVMLLAAAPARSQSGPLVVGDEPYALHPAPFEVPAISNPASDRHLVGKLVWLDLETTDLEGAKRFYHALFGWDYRDYRANGIAYTVALADGRPVAGLERRPIVLGAESPSAWLLFFSARDVDADFRQAIGAHAQVGSEPADRPLRGREARLTDPEGATFALVNSSSGDPPDSPMPGAVAAWATPSLVARDPASESVFYQNLFGYAVEGQPSEHGFGRISLSSAGRERAAVERLPFGSDDLRPQWIGYVRVQDLAATSQLAVKLGGRILVAPQGASDDKTAILADPSGAAFGVVQASSPTRSAP